MQIHVHVHTCTWFSVVHKSLTMDSEVPFVFCLWPTCMYKCMCKFNLLLHMVGGGLHLHVHCTCLLEGVKPLAETTQRLHQCFGHFVFACMHVHVNVQGAEVHVHHVYLWLTFKCVCVCVCVCHCLSLSSPMISGTSASWRHHLSSPCLLCTPTRPASPV